MGPDVDRPAQAQQPGARAGGGPAQAVELVAAGSQEGRPAADELSVRVGCEVCGARRTYRTASDTRAFFAVHPYACRPAAASPTGDAPTAGR